MKRRRFIQLSALVAGAAGLYLVRDKFPSPLSQHPLKRPEMLAHFCDEDQLRALGNSYRSLTPAENSTKKLRELILANPLGGQKDFKDQDDMASFIQGKINKDFQSNKLVELEGWILSVTEARQCALFSFES